LQNKESQSTSLLLGKLHVPDDFQEKMDR